MRDAAEHGTAEASAYISLGCCGNMEVVALKKYAQKKATALS